ncbi:hypothetical protein A2U01_0050472 [Trifolium medium]|uniref:Uncharacterized protein n=1 Tax=Trifolium medium TaxID=97028 RepID=A0A392QY22_9FABA|nr:hypothetical protein [Trifolium medium]
MSARQNLWHRDVIGDASVSTCVLCGLGLESTDHLFDFVAKSYSLVWYSSVAGVELVSRRGVLSFF